MYQLLVSTRADRNSLQGKGFLWLRLRKFQTIFVGRAWKNSPMRVRSMRQRFFMSVDQEAGEGGSGSRDQTVTFEDLPLVISSYQLVGPTS